MEGKRRYHFTAPDPRYIQTFYTNLLGKATNVKPGGRLAIGTRDDFTLATYVNEEHELVGVAAQEVPLSIHMGAALTLMPAHMMKTAVQTKKFDEMLWETVYEVYNISSRFFHDNGHGMVAIDKIYRSSDAPGEVIQFLRKGSRRVEVAMDVQGYGGGTMLLVAA